MRTQLVTARPTDSVAAAIEKMNDAGIGAILVCSDAALVGIFTERDVLRLAGRGAALDQVQLSEVMTANPTTISADDDILAAAQLMGERHVRHLPVVEGQNVLGMVSIRDVLGFLVERLWQEQDAAAHETLQALIH